MPKPQLTRRADGNTLHHAAGIHRPDHRGQCDLHLTNPEDSLDPRLGTPVTVWRYSPELLAMAKLRGAVSTVGHTTVTFTTIETRTNSRWARDLPIIRPAAPVFLALEDSFEPDPERKLTQEQVESMRRAGQRYAEPAQTQNR